MKSEDSHKANRNKNNGQLRCSKACLCLCLKRNNQCVRLLFKDTGKFYRKLTSISLATSSFHKVVACNVNVKFSTLFFSVLFLFWMLVFLVLRDRDVTQFYNEMKSP